MNSGLSKVVDVYNSATLDECSGLFFYLEKLQSHFHGTHSTIRIVSQDLRELKASRDHQD